jgi:hypothetical protein
MNQLVAPMPRLGCIHGGRSFPCAILDLPLEMM